jgi:thioredoxin reductase (NADPH)
MILDRWLHRCQAERVDSVLTITSVAVTQAALVKGVFQGPTQKASMSKSVHSKVLIIGSGPAGYTASIYAARANLQPLRILGMRPGGQLVIATDVEDYPGFAAPIQGPWLMEQMEVQAKHVGVLMRHDLIASVDLAQRPLRAVGDSGVTYTADTLIVATGAQARWLGLQSEQHLKGYSVSACATCDAFFYRGKEVAIVGGGNTAVQEAIFLTHFAAKVTLIHRRDQLTAERIMKDRLFANPKVHLIRSLRLPRCSERGKRAKVCDRSSLA